MAHGDTRRGFTHEMKTVDSEGHATIAECMGTRRSTAPRAKETERVKEKGYREIKGGIGDKERERRDKCNMRKKKTRKRNDNTLEDKGKWRRQGAR